MSVAKETRASRFAAQRPEKGCGFSCMYFFFFFFLNAFRPHYSTPDETRTVGKTKEVWVREQRCGSGQPKTKMNRESGLARAKHKQRVKQKAGYISNALSSPANLFLETTLFLLDYLSRCAAREEKRHQTTPGEGWNRRGIERKMAAEREKKKPWAHKGIKRKALLENRGASRKRSTPSRP